jgi:S-(hydroxymethyl)glutathione dehydrogenase / alcohol dehydrogenase
VKAAILRKSGAPLEVDDIALAPLPSGYVRVRLAASGVCHSDLSIQDGTIPHPTPVVLGHEGAGVVQEVGADVTTVEPGDHVVLSWIVPCRNCFYCRQGQPTLCEQGMHHAFSDTYATCRDEQLWCGLGTATFAEETMVPERAAIRIDPSFPLELAALVGCGVLTGVGAVINTAQVVPGASVAVVGCGGVGLSAIQGARLAGAAQVIAVDRIPAKLAMATDNGATHTVDASASDPVAAVQELTGGRGADYAFEVVGLSATIAQAYAMARRGGTVTVVGAGRFDDQVSFGAMNLMYDAKRLLGSVYGSADPERDIPRLLALADAGSLNLGRLITRRIDLEQINDAFQAMVDGEVARSVVTFAVD